MKHVVIGVWILVMAVAGHAWAQEEMPFSQGELARFMEDFPAFADHVESLGQALDQDDSAVWPSLLSAESNIGFLEERGWRIERFAYVISHVSMGLAAVSLAELAPELNAQLAEAKKAVEDNPGLTDEQKAELLVQMQEGMGASAQWSESLKELPGEEITLLRENKDRLMEIFDR